MNIVRRRTEPLRGGTTGACAGVTGLLLSAAIAVAGQRVSLIECGVYIVRRCFSTDWRNGIAAPVGVGVAASDEISMSDPLPDAAARTSVSFSSTTAANTVRRRLALNGVAASGGATATGGS